MLQNFFLFYRRIQDRNDKIQVLVSILKDINPMSIEEILVTDQFNPYPQRYRKNLLPHVKFSPLKKRIK